MKTNYLICTRWIHYGDEQIRITVDIWDYDHTTKYFSAGDIVDWQYYMSINDIPHNQFINDVYFSYCDTNDFF